MMQNAAAKRAEMTKSIEEKEMAKANAEEDHNTSVNAKTAAEGELAGTNEYLHQLHGECDWLLENFDLRKTARADETDALKKAKAILSGADFSLVQVSATINQH